MRTRKAFTLVELLVVISIITLLVGILVPSLKAAKDLSKVTKCTTNISATIRNLMLYVSANDGLLPPYRLKDPDPNTPPPENPRATTIAFGIDGSPTYDDINLLNDPRNLGLVYRRDYIPDYHMLYCPSQPNPENRSESYPPETEPNAWGSGTKQILAGYMFNPNVDANAPPKYLFLPKVDTFPADRPLVCDLAYGKDVASHAIGNDWRWNVGRLNGEVITVMSKTVQYYMDMDPSASSLATDWNLFNTRVYRILMQ
jgi:prepilin-type N-terminal cleavage/methylation domain-containing protein